MSEELRLEEIAHSVIDAGQEKPTLARLDCSFQSGQFHVVSGPSGAGKTTLLSILSLTVKATRGMIHYGEQNLTALRPQVAHEWRKRHIGMVFQTSRLIGMLTVAEHIRLAAATRGDQCAVGIGLALIEQLGLSAKLDQLPTELSGGEKQRVALAQALCFGPNVLLADEPTAALDQANADLVAAIMRDYARDRGAVVICVTHDEIVRQKAQTTLALEKP